MICKSKCISSLLIYCPEKRKVHPFFLFFTNYALKQPIHFWCHKGCCDSTNPLEHISRDEQLLAPYLQNMVLQIRCSAKFNLWRKGCDKLINTWSSAIKLTMTRKGTVHPGLNCLWRHLWRDTSSTVMFTCCRHFRFLVGNSQRE